MKVVDLLLPFGIVCAGAALIVSADGKVPRLPFAFGEYKNIVGLILVSMGVLIFVRIKR